MAETNDISAAHSKLGASSYSRYKACPGSIRESLGIESVESEYAREGTLAHELGEILLKGGKPPSDADEEMLEAVQVYVDYVTDYRVPTWQRWIEKKFDLTKYHPGLFGTADAVLYQPDSMRLIVVDYKHGRGVAVDAQYADGTPNSQLMFYGLGAMHELKLKVREVELVIVQPRCYHSEGPIRSKLVKPMELLDFSYQLIADAQATEKPDAPLNPGEHCRFCPATHKCPAVKSKALAQLKSPFSALETPSYDPALLSDALTNLHMMEAYIKSVREFAYQEAINGRVPPGYKLVDKRATRKWIDGVETEVDKMGGYVGLYNRKLVTPAQMEKVVTKEDFERLLPFISQESSGKTLVPTTDKRKEVAAKDSPFAALT